jgi:glycosyltransferase involved in cell wall biosynthesis
MPDRSFLEIVIIDNIFPEPDSKITFSSVSMAKWKEYTHQMASVAIVTNSLSGGGAERSMNLIANALNEKNQQVFLLAINDGPEDLIKLRVPVIEIKRKWKGSIGNSILSSIRFVREIRRIRPDIAIINCDLPELFSFFIPLSVKLICVEHTTNPWRGRRTLGFIVRTYLHLRRTTWVRVSNHINPWPKSLKFQVVIPNPLPLFLESRASESKKPIRRLVFIGRLSAEKNPMVLIEIGKRLNLDVLIIGDGIQLSQLQNLTVTNEVRSEFLGRVINPWVYIKNDDLLVVPSEYEGDGLVVLEALSRGIPFIISKIPAFLRFNFPTSNYFGSVDEFIKIFDALKDRPDLLIPPRDLAHSLISQRNIDSVSANWVDLIKRILNSH